MTGVCEDGSLTISSKAEAQDYRGLLEPDTARRLRHTLLRSLRAGGYTAEQIAQITGWGSRTVRRELAKPIEREPFGLGVDLEPEDLPPEHDQAEDDDRPSRRKGQLTAGQYRELLREYSAEGLDILHVPDADRDEVVAFLKSLSQ